MKKKYEKQNLPQKHVPDKILTGKHSRNIMKNSLSGFNLEREFFTFREPSLLATPHVWSLSL
jgi:hypothetical protein